MPSEQLSPLIAAHSRGMMRWMAAIMGDLQAPANVDAAMFNAMLIGAIQQLVLASSGAGQLSGLPLQTHADWQRVEAGLEALIEQFYPA